MRGNHIMRIFISILMILGACFVVLTALLSVVHDLLLRTSTHAPSELDRRDIGPETAGICHETSEHLQ
jgi:ABC-type lipoprotein release transport system permease subunit